MCKVSENWGAGKLKIWIIKSKENSLVNMGNENPLSTEINRNTCVN